jgi:hypothetical protein
MQGVLPAIANLNCSRQYADERQVDKTIVDALEIVLDKTFVLACNDNNINFAYKSYGQFVTSEHSSISSVRQFSTWLRANKNIPSQPLHQIHDQPGASRRHIYRYVERPITIERCFEARNRSFRKDVNCPTRSCSWLSSFNGSHQIFFWRHIEKACLDVLVYQHQYASILLPVLIPLDICISGVICRMRN